MFITLEGIDGSGKTTQIELLAQYLIAQGYKVLKTREPGGGGDFALKIRETLKTSDTLPISELFAIYAARNEHLEKIIKPALANNIIVLCDRFIDSSVSYLARDKNQTFETAFQTVSHLHKMIDGIMPDITFLLNIEKNIALERLKKRENTLDKYDNLDLEQRNKIFNSYLKLKDIFPDRIQIINASLSEEEVFAQIQKIFLSKK